MIIRNKREFFWLRYRLTIVPVACAVAGMVFGIFGKDYATFEKMNGIFTCPEWFEFLLKCVVFPLSVTVISVFVGNARKTVVSFLIAKIATAITGLIFGTNTNIQLSLLPGDWEFLFFIAVDVWIILAVFRSRDAKAVVFRITAVATAVMLLSHLVLQLKGDFAADYAYRVVFLMLFYFSVSYFVHCTTHRWFPFPTPEEWAKIQEKEVD